MLTMICKHCICGTLTVAGLLGPTFVLWSLTRPWTEPDACCAVAVASVPSLFSFYLALRLACRVERAILTWKWRRDINRESSL